MPPPIRIAFCITELDPGGAERALTELVRRLDRELFAPVVFCLGPPGELGETLKRADIPVQYFHAKGLRDVNVVFRLAKALRKFRPRILQTWLYHANLLGRIAGRLAQVPTIVSGIRVAERRSRWRLRAERFTEGFVAAHVCVSQAVAEFSIQQGGLNPALVHVIPNGVDVARFANAEPVDLGALGLSSAAKTLLCVGRLDPQKDPLWLLEAFPKLRSLFDNVHLLYAGTGPLESSIKARIKQLHFEECVHCLGWRSDIPALLKSADALVLPSRWEGMPNVVLEAFAAGLPVVAAQVEGISELITPGETGRIVSSRNVDELVGHLSSILNDPQGAFAMAQSAQTLVKEKFTWEINSRSYQKLYQELIQKLPDG